MAAAVAEAAEGVEGGEADPASSLAAPGSSAVPSAHAVAFCEEHAPVVIDAPAAAE